MLRVVKVPQKVSHSHKENGSNVHRCFISVVFKVARKILKKEKACKKFMQTLTKLKV
jgi:hypothetical protein